MRSMVEGASVSTLRFRCRKIFEARGPSPPRPGAPLPPRYARSPFPAVAGQDILILPDDDLGADRHAGIEIDHVVVDEPEAAGRDGLADGLRRVGAMDAIDG